jgi:hypothetical protein
MADIFFSKLKTFGDEPPPIFSDATVHFIHIRRNGLYVPRCAVGSRLLVVWWWLFAHLQCNQAKQRAHTHAHMVMIATMSLNPRSNRSLPFDVSHHRTIKILCRHDQIQHIACNGD